MNSDLNPLATHPVFARWREDLAASRKWHEENPQLARDWEEALDLEADIQREIWRTKHEADVAGRLPKILSAAGVPMRCWEALGGPLLQTPALKAVGEFEDQATTFLLLLGAAGSGKSLAAASAVKRSIWRDMMGREVPGKTWRHVTDPSARFARSADLARMSQYDREDQRDFAALCDAGLLVVDDLGAEQVNSNWLALLDELIDHRYGERLQTILTTNLDAEAFKKRYGERISDRIRHDGVIVGAGTESLRRRSP